MKRNDKELQTSYRLSFIKNLEVCDWPTYEYSYFNQMPAKHTRQRFYLNLGIIFLAKYDIIIASRLHGAILALLLNIPTIIVDNSYGKNKTYYSTWFKNFQNCFFAEGEEEIKTILTQHFPDVQLSA